ncbi:MAG: T9SS type A sorting domain-containing protein, partial [Flavobacteriales bacterium]|nr:T9SS type A sorting domain-containing protein [Flavobacteriales bacterium]
VSVNIQVFNILGQEVAHFENVTAMNNKVKVLDPQKVMGTYFVRVETDTRSDVSKVIY